MPAKFIVKKGPTGKFRFNLVAPNGQVVATSQAYESKAACVAGVRSVQKNAAGAAIDDLTAAAKPAAARSCQAAAKPAPARAAARKPAARKKR